MLDKNQQVVNHATVVNASHLAVALASRVFGNSLSEKVSGENLSRKTITAVVIGDIRSKFNVQGVVNAQ